MNTKLLMIVGGVVLVILIGAGIFLYMNRDTTATAQPSPSASPSSTASNFYSSASPVVGASSSPNIYSSSSPQISNNSVLSVDPTTEQAATLRRLSLALEKTKDWGLWKSNAILSGLVISFAPSLDYNSANEVYIFDSPDDTANHYTVSVSQATSNALRAVIPVADYQGVLKPINRTYWKASYIDALIIALNNGGRQFAANNTVTSVELILRRSDPNDYLQWIVKFNTKTISNTLTVKVDAEAKTVVK